MTTIRIEQALARAKERGNRVMKKELAERIWPASNAETRRVNINRLCSGMTERICPEWVVIICQMLDCSADFLFGLKDE